MTEELDEIPDEEDSGHVDFGSFVLSLATNALMNLTTDPIDDRIAGAKLNLKVASQHIDILAMLHEKTRGNLSTEEQELLESVLYDLRMHFVQAAERKT
ncbi:MAG: DUF1844 domain-containing protein [Deltaproteobacteria bacterium]|nr:DUF1844 domain-containing protein [Deltaproteobacteria bacterium]